MRCSRVGGVILYSFDNGHFMAYTSPPPPAEPLLKEKPFGECTFQLSPIAVQRLHSYSTTPPWHADRRSAQGVRSTTKGEIFKGTDGACANPDTQNFPCHGGGAAVPPSSFISLTFTSQRSLLWYFLGLQESTVPLRPFPVFPAYAISSISYSRVPMPSFSPCSRPACQLVSGNSAVK